MVTLLMKGADEMYDKVDVFTIILTLVFLLVLIFKIIFGCSQDIWKAGLYSLRLNAKYPLIDPLSCPEQFSTLQTLSD